MSIPRDGDSLLNANQRRHYEVVLARLEDALSHVAPPSPPLDGVESHALTRVDDDLPVGFRDAATPRIIRARAIIREAADRWELAPRTLSRRRAARAALTAQLIQLEDSTTSGLRGYGAVNPRAAVEIDPVIAELHELVADLLALLKAPG